MVQCRYVGSRIHLAVLDASQDSNFPVVGWWLVIAYGLPTNFVGRHGLVERQQLCARFAINQRSKRFISSRLAGDPEGAQLTNFQPEPS